MTVVTTLKHCVVAPPVQLQNYVSWVFHESETSQERHQLEDTYERDSGPSNCASTWVVSTCTGLVLLILVGTLTYQLNGTESKSMKGGCFHSQNCC
uniref:Uncharacterized protein n=1 Tax=Trichuris muris TaxID=70415 RepID=A0A5S6QA02_TRIMR